MQPFSEWGNTAAEHWPGYLKYMVSENSNTIQGYFKLSKYKVLIAGKKIIFLNYGQKYTQIFSTIFQKI